MKIINVLAPYVSLIPGIGVVLASIKLDNNPVVNEQQFNDALSFRNCDFIQIEKSEYNWGQGINQYRVMYTPTLTWLESVQDYPLQRTHIYQEQYVRKIDENTYEGLERNDEDQDYYEKLTSDEAKIAFITKEFLITYLFSPSSYYEYSKYEYDGKTKSYTYTYDGAEEQNYIYTIELKFLNGKLINIVHDSDYMPLVIDSQTSITYKKESPIWPV